MDFEPSPAFAGQLDRQDPLSNFRSRFIIAEPDLIYLDGNSLGRLAYSTLSSLQPLMEQEWGRRLIRGWNENWWEAPQRVGDKIAPLLGASPGEVILCNTVSLNLYKLASAALALRPGRTHIITDTLNFPTDLYILQGLIDPSSPLNQGSQDGKRLILRVGSLDEDITPDLDALAAVIDEHTALVTLSHVTFKSGYLYDMAEVTRLAHQHGALVIWDLSHSVGAVPLALDAGNVDFAVGCTYKYLNGGPGSPAFLYVRKDLQEQTVSPIWGWWGQNTPFAFDLDYTPARGIQRFLTGTQPILSLRALEAALDPLLDAGVDALRAKSLLLTEYLIYLSDTFLSPLGFVLGSPRRPERRGSHISLRHPEGYRINRALIEDMQVIPDFRAPDNLRLGLAPLYTTFSEVRQAVDRICRVLVEGLYLQYPSARQTVT